MKVAGITGGSGFVGSYLTNLLKANGYKVVVFSRHPEKHKNTNHVKYAYWGAEENKCDLRAFKDLDAVINLAGAGIADKRWTEKRKKEIVDSRVKGTEFLVEQLRQYAPNCKTLVSASAIGYYGADMNGRAFKEDDPPGTDFLAETCQLWEQAALKAKDMMRTVILRFGIVLGKEAGVYHSFAQPMNFGIAPILGDGKQIISWIHVEDLAEMLKEAIENTGWEHIYNAVSPAPVAHKDLVKIIADKKGGIKIPAPVPAFVLKAALGELSQEVLKSCTVDNSKVANAGFQFKYPGVETAIKAIVDK